MSTQLDRRRSRASTTRMPTLLPPLVPRVPPCPSTSAAPGLARRSAVRTGAALAAHARFAPCRSDARDASRRRLHARRSRRGSRRPCSARSRHVIARLRENQPASAPMPFAPGGAPRSPPSPGPVARGPVGTVRAGPGAFRAPPAPALAVTFTRTRLRTGRYPRSRRPRTTGLEARMDGDAGIAADDREGRELRRAPRREVARRSDGHALYPAGGRDRWCGSRAEQSRAHGPLEDGVHPPMTFTPDSSVSASEYGTVGDVDVRRRRGVRRGRG